ncbi:TIGR03013 family PEP-CTERM/XrtA system glycosyltransferase [Thalassotalea fonticola]|uniref:TIGR03013 family PEP-CTERM/XrtA system glycosyltransferase n=1 Tax=Thalassotalea fonticola TaxID=3065649 RepID=A0ABZ0GUE2_9GAMM|nr:TIGR03013 family PEP-CTERM/XrtA system glycosyltransferase [Colwelliaceae bacterium S1-1]
MLRLLLLGDIGLFFIAFFLSNVDSFSETLTIEIITSTVLFVFIMQLSFLGLGLYKSKIREKLWGILRRLLIASAISYILLTIFGQLTGNPYLHTDFVLTACFISFISTAIFRLLLFKFNVLGFAKRNILVLGSGQRALVIETRMRREVDRQGYNLIGFVPMGGDINKEIAEEHIVILSTSLVQFVLQNQIHEIVVATDERRGTLPIDELFACKIRGVSVTEILDFIENETGQIAVNLIYPSWVIYSQGFTSSNDLRATFDRLFNSGLAIVLFILTWPFMLLAAFAIKIEDGIDAPILYWQERIGFNGKVFKIVKFRSMTLDAECDGAKWAEENDTRVTKVGRFIRKYRLDELPQIYNILTADMGFVGPRPERPEFVDRLKVNIPYYSARHTVKSGLTGWAQLKYAYGATEEDAMEKLKYDLYYIKHRSFMMDLLILIQTAEVVLFGRGR